MISYLYWAAVIAASLLLVWIFSYFFKLKVGGIVGLVFFLVGWSAYHFYYEQFFVKNLGGIMVLEVPRGQMHISSTWKDDHLWIENYDPESNTCYFNEVSKSHLLEGQVSIKNCNPILLTGPNKP